MTEMTAQRKDHEEDALQDRYLTFSLASESYGIEIRYITEIIGVQPITEVPELPDYLKGIVNLRGKIIPVMDVLEKLKKATCAYTPRTCVIIVDINGLSTGLIVDNVAEVLSIPASEISLPLEVSKSGYIKGVGKVGGDVKLIIDCSKLFIEQDKLVINI